MSKARIYARNLLANWIGYGANLVVMFFLSPFVVHSLGNTTYGVWSLIVSLTGYLGLAELGTRGGLGRFINYYLGRDEIDKVNAVISTALGFFLACGVLLFAAAGVLSLFFHSIFTKVPAELIGGARLAIMLIALNLWLSFFGAAFNQILTAQERFDIFNGINLIVLAVRTAGTVIALKMGGGIVELAAVQVVSSIIGVLGACAAAYRIFPRLHLRPSLISRTQFRELFGFSIWAFVGGIAGRLLYWTDIVLIGILLGPVMVTFYSIPLMLIHYTRGIVTQVSRVLGPQTIKASSVGDYRELRWIFGWGSKVIMFLAIPLFMGLIVFGTEFITLWMPWRPAECRLSGSVLALLGVPQLVVWALSPGAAIIRGLGYVRFGAVMTLSQGAANLGLTLFFVIGLGLGLQGVALGTLIPMVIFNIAIGAVILRWIHFPLREFLHGNVLRWVVTAGLLGCIFYGTSLMPGRGQWAFFWVKVVGMAFVAMALGWLVVFTREEQNILRERVIRLSRGSERTSEPFPRRSGGEA